MIYLIILTISAVWAGLLGRSKGSSPIVWFIVGMVAIIPFLGVIIAACYRYETDEVRRQCETCGNVVALYDQVCTRCGNDLEFPDVAIEPESVAHQRG